MTEPVDRVDVVIVGAGPSGCITGEIVARKGYDVLILEEHSEIGEPVQCTGLVSHRIGKIPKEIIVNKIKKARFYSKNNYFEIKSKKPVYLIDRKKYDKYLGRKAKKAGAKFKLSTRFLDFRNRKVITTKGAYETSLLVGADGPNSTVAKVSGLKLPGNLLKATQVNAKSNFDSDTVKLWFGSEVAPGSFAWVVPENEEIARIGLMAFENPSIYLEKFLKKIIGRIETTNRTGDVMRYGLIKKSVADNVLLVGDAACQVKPFSAGGLIYGKVGAGLAGKACIAALESNDFSEKFLFENYEKEWKKKLANPIRLGMIMKKIFYKIQDRPLAFTLIKNFGIAKLSSLLDVDFLEKS
ncbi:MAG: NAD(P)/FAD-dependent oxidoreductase [Candidatus Aenigmarchaeota archaeon]|nr:NAD(P)/FAD-dependent oxidoreductase [Candidatus Aenigmarchaeota archaeon]